MSFEKRNYISEQTVITAKNLNDIQDELIRQAKENNTPIATAEIPGKVKPGSNFSVAEDGTLNLADGVIPTEETVSGWGFTKIPGLTASLQAASRKQTWQARCRHRLERQIPRCSQARLSP